MPLSWQPFVDAVRSRRRFLLTTHVRPDPDGLGSMLGLAGALAALDKDVSMVVSSVYPPRYDFMDPGKRIARFHLPGDAYRSCEAVVVLDTGTWNQLGEFGDFLRTLSVPRFVIDHHPTQDDLGATRLVDVTAEATGRLVYDAIQALKAPVSKTIAQDLFAALATDTGWFRHSNTSPATFALAEALVRAGANPTWLYEQIYEQNRLARLHLMGRVLERIKIAADGMIAYTELRRADYQETGAIPSDSEDLVNFTRGMAGVEVGLFFMEQPEGGVKVSFRSREKVNVSQIAERFGGGGHRLASGAILQTTLDEAERRVLEAVTAALNS
ncbi:MAG: bifunctional oligoribonuclease/PAP phosphatase NrnA [Gemmataceae bacterium]